MKMNPKLKPRPFLLAGHEHPHSKSRNETSVAGKERTRPGPVIAKQKPDHASLRGCFGDRVSELDLAPGGTPRLGGAVVLVESRAAGGERVLGLQ